MKTLLYLLVVAGAALCPGCELAGNMARTTSCEVGHFAREGLERIRDRHLAEEAWKQVQASCPDRAYSKDYARGFKAGYADYLFEGGPCEPPPFPPESYWGIGYQTPDGVRAMAEWNTGFRDGAAAAEASGLREVMVLPLTDDPPPGPPPPPAPPGPAPAPAGDEPLAAPRKVPLPETLPAPAAQPAQPPPRKQDSPLPPGAGPAAGRTPTLPGGSSPEAPPARQLPPEPVPVGSRQADDQAGGQSHGPGGAAPPRTGSEPPGRDGPPVVPFGAAGYVPGPG
jgi:hypothetical protein